MKKYNLSLLTGLLIFMASGLTIAGSETPYPSDWKSWKNTNTVLAGIGALPGCEADVSTFPPIYQETIETYCGVRPEGPGAVAILVNPKIVDAYTARSGAFPDGSNMILHLKELKLLFVSGHKNSQPVYGVFQEDGTDITAGDGILSAGICRECHSGYEAFCHGGQCGTAQ